MNRRTEQSMDRPVPAETEYLISDVEELVNREIDAHLDGNPFHIEVKNYKPLTPTQKAPYGVTRIDRDIVQKIAPGIREFTGIDLDFNFPLSQNSENPFNVSLKWSDGIQCRLAIVDNRPIMLIERGDHNEAVLFASSPEKEIMRTHLESVGLPETIWASNIKNLIGDITDSSAIKISRTSEDIIDIGTKLEITHESFFAVNILGDKEVTQELCVSLDHQSIPTDESNNPGFIQLAPQSIYRNMLRFNRNDSGDAWQYRGAYEGKLRSGELIDELVQIDPKLGIPRSKLLDKAIAYLSERPY